MINFDFYRNNPTAAATLIAREGDCGCCPMYNKCDSAPAHDDYDKCFEKWMRFLKFSSETLGSVDDFSELLSIMIDCDKCIVKKLNECDFSDTKDCTLTFCKWLCNEFTTICQESRQVESEAENCEPAVSFNGSFLKKLEQAAKKMEPDKEYTLTERLRSEGYLTSEYYDDLEMKGVTSVSRDILCAKRCHTCGN